jgi:hypothetical protein
MNGEQVAIPRTNPPKRGRRPCGLRSFHWRAKGTSGEESKAAEGMAWVQPVTGEAPSDPIANSQ